MDVFEAIAESHSYRGSFTGKKPTRDELKKIVEAGLAAPSGKNGQTTRFVIIDDEKLISELKRMHPGSKAMQEAAAYIACVISREPEAVYEGFSFEVEDCAAAVENILLAVTALGYATVWVDGWLRVEQRAEKIGKLVGVPDDKIIRVILPVGEPDREVKGPPKKPFDQRVCYNSYDL